MNTIPFAFTLAISLLIAPPSYSANPTPKEVTLQSQQQLTGMREAFGLDENHSFELKSLDRMRVDKRMSASSSSITAYASGAGR